MDDQTIFDTVATHLFEQGKPALSNDGGCAYRGQDGCVCAAGKLISDDDYRPIWEGMSFRKHMVPGLNSCFSESLILKLQQVHDTAVSSKHEHNKTKNAWLSTNSMRDALEVVAIKFRLDPSILKTLQFKDR